MEKVIVNKTVAGWIEKYNHYTTEEQLRRIMNDIYEDDKNFTSSMKDFLEVQNIDIVTLVKAIQYGYEVPYEFKAGDVIVNTRNNHVFIENGRNADGLEFINKHKEFYNLICKAENREDLQGVSNEDN